MASNFLAELIGALSGGLGGVALQNQQRRERSQRDFENDLRARQVGYVPVGSGEPNANPPASVMTPLSQRLGVDVPPPPDLMSTLRSPQSAAHALPIALTPPTPSIQGPDGSASLRMAFGGSTVPRQTSALIPLTAQPSALPSPSQSAPRLAVPFESGSRDYEFDYDRSPAGMVERRQADRDKLANMKAWHTLKTTYPGSPSSTDDYDDTMDYTRPLREADSEKRITLRKPDAKWQTFKDASGAIWQRNPSDPNDVRPMLDPNADTPTQMHGSVPRAASPSTPRDPNVSAATATNRLLTGAKRDLANTEKSLPKFSALSMNPQADSTAVINQRQPILNQMGPLAIRADSLQGAADQQTAAIGTGTRATGAVDVSPLRDRFEQSRQQLQAIMQNPRIPLAEKAKAQQAFLNRLRALGRGFLDQ